jgi:hypothetical protein
LRSDNRVGPWRRLITSPHTLVIVFAAVATTELAHHEMWVDELNPWDIARDAHTLRDLFYNMRFEPHPRLWYLCLFALTRLTHNPAAMQILHGVIGTASVALLAYSSPFRRRDVWLLAFGYYIVFEFCAISRGYALGILFALGACAAAAAARPRIALIAALLALLANTSLFGVILAASLGLALSALLRGRRPVELASAGAIAIAGIALSLWTLMPSPGSQFGRTRFVEASLQRLDDISGLLGSAYVPLPDFTSQSPWNSSLLVAGGRYIPYAGHFTGAIVGVLILLLAIGHVRRHPSLVVALTAGTGAILALIYVEYSGGYRHHGHVFLLLLLVVWLHDSRAGTARVTPRWFTAVVMTQAVAGLFFAGLDFERPFSASKDLARFFKGESDLIPIVVAQPHFLSYAGPPLSAYLGHRIYYAVSGGVVRGSYLWYDEARARGASEDEIVAEITQFARSLATDVFVVASHWDSRRLGERVAEFPPATIEGDERATKVYRFKKPE